MPVGEETVRLERDGVECTQHLGAVARILDQIAPLLDDRLGDRVVEAPLRQNELERLALADLAGLILSAQRQAHAHAGPGWPASSW